MAPSRASAASRGVRGPRCRGVNATTIIASTGFTVPTPSPLEAGVFAISHNSKAKHLAKLASEVARCPAKLELALRQTRSGGRLSFRERSPAPFGAGQQGLRAWENADA